ncbi:hypothetical protein ABZV61_40450 [Streptomyces sp900116325]|uniref:Transcriptional regulator n=1 Tax=Streptomyces sp. 900116325 TaxID=3154295 RepID=A0ABV2ULW3_9ACTN
MIEVHLDRMLSGRGMTLAELASGDLLTHRSTEDERGRPPTAL